MGNKEKDEEEVVTFFIPNNFTDSGKILDGMVSLRNALEAVFLTFLLYLLEKNILFPLVEIRLGILIMAVTLIPVFISCVIGINGDCFTIFVKSLFVYLKNRRKLRYRRIEKNDIKKLQSNKKPINTKKKTNYKARKRK